MIILMLEQKLNFLPLSMTFIDFIFFFYIFIGLYMSSLLALLFIYGRQHLFSYPSSKPVPVSIVVPCYNAGSRIGKVLESLLHLDYPQNMIEIIVVDDKSTDNSAEVVSSYALRYPCIHLIKNKRNSGAAAEPTNIGIRHASHDYIAVTDDDSTPRPDALKKMLGFLQKDSRVAAVTCAVLAKPGSSFIQQLQAIEYYIIALNRKLLDTVDSVYVTPGPFALYRKRALLEVGLFDTANMTQDIEIVWRLLSRGYLARMCLSAQVYSETPHRFAKWFKQRVRWNVGGLQCMLKYRSFLFRKGMLGAFIIPFFSFSLFLGVFGLGLFFYLIAKRLIVSYLSVNYSLYANSSILYLQDLSFSPSILNFFGGALFLLGFFFTLYGLGVMKEVDAGAIRERRNIFNILFYLLVYLAIYPFIMITSLYKLLRGTYTW